MATMKARIVHLSIRCNWQDVYRFASNPRNMPQWASGLAAGLRQEGDHWTGDGGPIGEIKIRFTPDNRFGVIDHEVTLANGETFFNALRVQPNGNGAEVSFTLLQPPGMSDSQADEDAAIILTDLQTLKRLTEMDS